MNRRDLSVSRIFIGLTAILFALSGCGGGGGGNNPPPSQSVSTVNTEIMQAGIETQRLISTAVGIVMSQTNRPQDLAFDLVDSVSSANSVLSGLRSVK